MKKHGLHFRNAAEVHYFALEGNTGCLMYASVYHLRQLCDITRSRTSVVDEDQRLRLTYARITDTQRFRISYVFA